MIPKCFKCHAKISLSWFILSLMSTRYRCIRCGSLYEFTNRHRYLGVFFAVPLVFLVIMLEGFITSALLRVILLISVAILIMILIPGQHQLSEKDNLEIKKRNSN